MQEQATIMPRFNPGGGGDHVAMWPLMLACWSASRWDRSAKEK